MKPANIGPKPCVATVPSPASDRLSFTNDKVKTKPLKLRSRIPDPHTYIPQRAGEIEKGLVPWFRPVNVIKPLQVYSLLSPKGQRPKAKGEAISMASTPTPTATPTPTLTPTPPQPQSLLLPIKAAARKLPVKRKTPDNPSSAPADNPSPSPITNPNPNCTSAVPNPIPKIETADDEDDNIIDGEDLEAAAGDDLKPPPFKFHRIWPESDEIRFLQGLLVCSADGLVFPRDLPLFYDRFSKSMHQPYTKSQLSEKLRRLRKKFRVISTRISRGLDPLLLAPHDRALFDLSKQLWDHSYASSSPFQSNKRKPSKVSVSVSFSPNPSACLPPPLPLPPPPPPPPVLPNIDDTDMIEEDIKLNLENNLGRVHEEEEEPCLPVCDEGGFSGGSGLGRFAAKTIMDVFDRSLKEVRMTLVRQELLFPDQTSTSTTAGSSKQERAVDFEKRWREQRAAELDVLARRLRLVVENAINQR